MKLHVFQRYLLQQNSVDRNVFRTTQPSMLIFTMFCKNIAHNTTSFAASSENNGTARKTTAQAPQTLLFDAEESTCKRQCPAQHTHHCRVAAFPKGKKMSAKSKGSQSLGSDESKGPPDVFAWAERHEQEANTKHLHKASRL